MEMTLITPSSASRVCLNRPTYASRSRSGLMKLLMDQSNLASTSLPLKLKYMHIKISSVLEIEGPPPFDLQNTKGILAAATALMMKNWATQEAFPKKWRVEESWKTMQLHQLEASSIDPVIRVPLAFSTIDMKLPYIKVGSSNLRCSRVPKYAFRYPFRATVRRIARTWKMSGKWVDQNDFYDFGVGEAYMDFSNLSSKIWWRGPFSLVLNGFGGIR